MVKNLLLLSLCALFMQTSPAQNWCQPGATWHYKHYMLGPVIGAPLGATYHNGISDYRYVNDTIISGITCNHINGTYRGQFNSWTPPATYYNYRNYYTYQNNKVVYVWSGASGGFDTIVNFNAAIGDKWRSNTLAGSCNRRGTITVIDTGRVLINNLSLKKIVTTYSNTVINGNNTYTISGGADTIIERIMSRVNFMFPMYCDIDNPPPVDSPVLYNGEFNCYEDDNFALYKRAGVVKCEYDIVGFQELSAAQFPVRLYPNPSSGFVIMESEHFTPQELYRVSMINTLGQCVYQKEVKATNNQVQLSFDRLSAGVYYLRLADKNGVMAVEKIIREKD